ncbi:MAG: ATP-dependent Clp protease proteolytic subunit [Planctomycetes bacterium]|nr:ATP-dependent Clp protease proteolytic subunit [Planctomycetota bacterium]
MPNQGIYPTIVEKSGNFIKSYDVFSRLLEDRIVFIGTPIDDMVADQVVGQLLWLDRSGRNQDIKMYINSPGGSVTAGLAIYDTMQLIEPQIQTYCVGQAASMGAVLLAAGAAGKRFALPHSRIMIHQPWGGAQGTALDMEIQVKEILKMKAALEEILAKHSGRTAKEVSKACDRDNFMSAPEAKAFGLIDEVISKATPETPPK